MTSDKALLPAGLRDLLPPHADLEAKVIERLTKVFTRNGYDRVKPPLIEFEDHLLAGPGSAMTDQTFRVMDPQSQRMMGLRADMTPQVARIAASRLARLPRPLRLSYAGQVLRVSGTHLRPERQGAQAGIELIGVDNVAGEAEVILVALDALAEAEAPPVTLDLNLPPFVPALCAALGIPEDQATTLRRLLEQKDFAEAQRVAGEHASQFAPLVKTVGALEGCLPALEALVLPEAVRPMRDALVALARRVQDASPEADITLDPLEHRGFEYYDGPSFTLFGRGVRGELGRGGRYRSFLEPENAPCVGVTLYLDAVTDHAPLPPEPRRVLVPADLSWVSRRKLQAEQWVTVTHLPDAPGALAGTKDEAQRLGCSHVLPEGGMPVALHDLFED